jgi:P pilus assembly chaperone PapD
MKSVTLCALGVALSLSALSNVSVQAAGMIPATSVVILNEAEGETSINVKNSDSRPALLYSQIIAIDGDDDNLIVLTPPVARVEAGETQAIRFLLQTSEPLKVQRLRRVTFEGIVPKNNAPGMQVNMNVRQNLPVIIHPKGLVKDNAPWRRLKWSVQRGKLQVSNPDAYVVRLDQAIRLQPGNGSAQLPRPYLLPGERVTLEVPANVLTTLTGVMISPATVYGFSVDQYSAALVR